LLVVGAVTWFKNNTMKGYQSNYDQQQEVSSGICELTMTGCLIGASGQMITLHLIDRMRLDSLIVRVNPRNVDFAKSRAYFTKYLAAFREIV
jgi:hypothetical protein